MSFINLNWTHTAPFFLFKNRTLKLAKIKISTLTPKIKIKQPISKTLPIKLDKAEKLIGSNNKDNTNKLIL